MIVIKCPTCGKKVVWDDFQPGVVKCPKCRQDISMMDSFKESIRIREFGEDQKKERCPYCKGDISRRWFVKCPKCSRFVFGNFSFSGKWPFMIGLAILYLLFSLFFYYYT